MIIMAFVNEQMRQARQQIHHVLKPLVLSLSYMINNFDQNAFAAQTPLGVKIADAMDNSLKRIAGENPCMAYKDFFANLKFFMIMMANAERKLFPEWLKIIDEEFHKAKVFS